MTYRELLEKMIKEMTIDELADFIDNNDFRNMALFDTKLKGDTNKEKIRQLLESEVES